VEKKQQAKVAGLRLKTLQRQVEPTLRAVNEKMDYRDLVDEVVVEREQELARAERAADAEARKFDASEENIKTAEQSIESEKQVDKSRRQELQSIQRQVTQLKAALRGEPPVFNAADFNSRIRAEELKLRALREEKIELEERERAVTEQGRQIRFQTSAKQKELQSLESREGANLVKLRRVSRDAAVAWEWIQNNRDQFEKEIFGPPIVECNIKDKNYIPAIESIFQRNHLLTFTVQSNNDFTRLNNQLYNVMRLGDITINTVQRGFAEQRRSPVSNERLRNLGLDGWAIDYVEGPDAVLAMLCISVRLDKTAVALRDIDEAQYDTIMNSDVTALVAGKSSYSIVRRREYGPGAVSTSHKTIKDPQLFTDAPVDTAVKNDIQRSLQELQSNFEALKSEIRPIKDRIAEIQSELVETDKKLKAIQLDKNEAQKHHVQFQSLPNRLGREEDKLKKKMRDGEDFETRMDDLKHQVEQLVLERNAIAIEHKQCVDTIRQLHAELLEAKLRQIEANSDVDALKAKNAGIVNQLDEEKHRFQRAEQEREIYKKRGSEAMQKIQEFIRQDPTYQEFFSSLDENLTLEELEQDIIAERSKLEFIRDSNPGALRQYEARKATIEQLQEKIAAAQEQIDHLDAQLTDIRGRWEPELDKVIEEISSAFAKNFEQIGCTGQVGVHKDEDFDNWSVEIRVKFRETESLQVLDAHRQSGGERAVSTIFYLMALQALARAPFRVVDEINQGMDPKNERMMHERMVEIACREHTSQYFLITPKLLAGLRYDPKMRILCIASGEHMPVDYRQLDIHKVIATKRALALTVR
jgi:chromosome segregation ATPase